MSQSLRYFKQGIQLRGETVDDSSNAEGSLFHNSTDQKIRSYIQGAVRELITNSQTQTLTNKTIDADSNTITNIENADIKAGAAIARTKLASGTANRVAVNDGSGVLSDAASITAARALISDANGIPTHSTVTSTELGYVSGVTSAIQTQLGNKADSSTLTAHTGASSGVHGVTGSVVGTTDTQTLSNKTFSDAVTLPEISTPSTPSSGFGKIYFKNDNSLYQLSDTGVESKVGSGSGSKNYITNFDASQGITGWVVYADAAGTSPVDGTGGSPSVTITQNTTTPLSGNADFLFTKDAANRQGQGTSYDFTIDRADRGSILRLSADYISSANYADGDMRGYFYDVTNARVIEPDAVQILASAQGHFFATFQSSPDSTSYRLILHVASTNASAYTLEFDNVVVGPNVIAKGPVVTDWQSYTPTFTGFGTPTSVEFFWRRVGSELEISGKFTPGTTTAVEARVNFPTGLTSASTAVIPTIRNAGGTWIIGGANTQHGGITLMEPNVSYFTFGRLTTFSGANSDPTSKEIGNIGFSSNVVYVTAKVPIAGWSSNQVSSADAGQRQILTVLTKNASQSLANGTDTKVTFPTLVKDSTGAWDSTNNRFVCPESGDYKVIFTLNFASNATGSRYGAIAKNGTIDFTTFRINNSGADPCIDGSTRIFPNCVKGDYLEIFATQGSGGSLNLDQALVSFEKIQTNQQVIASELICAVYNTNAGQTIADSTVTIVDFEDKVFDTHNAVTTGASWKFTVPVSGKYFVDAYTTYSNAASFGAGTSTQGQVFVNGVAKAIRVYSVDATVTIPRQHGVSILLDCIKGDTIDYRTRQSSGGNRSFDTASTQNQISIFKISGV